MSVVIPAEGCHPERRCHPHRHEAREETIYGIDGILTFTLQGRTIEVGSGEPDFRSLRSIDTSHNRLTILCMTPLMETPTPEESIQRRSMQSVFMGFIDCRNKHLRRDLE
jgi:hypothetical protein